MSESMEMSDFIRRAARRNTLRFNDQGRLVPAETLESAASETNDQPERHVEGSADGGKGNDISIPHPRHESSDMNALIRRAVEKGS